MNLQARKILKENLSNIKDPDVKKLLMSFTENGELFINRNDGSQLKISDIVFKETEQQILETCTGDATKLFIALNDKCIMAYDNTTSSFVKISNSTEALESNVNILLEKATKHEEATEQLKTTVEGLTTELRELDSTVDELTEDVETYKRENTNAISEIRQSVNSVSEQMNGVVGDLSSVKEKNTELEKGLDSVKEKAAETNQTLTELEKKVETNTNGIQDIKVTIEEMKTSISDIETNIESLEQKNTEIEAKLNAPKIFNVDFVIKDRLVSGLEIADIFDIENVIHEGKHSVKIESIKMKSTTMVTQAITMIAIHRQIDETNGSISDTEIGEVTINANSIKAETQCSLVGLQKGYLVLKVKDSGSNNNGLINVVIRLSRA